jgi:hypothetical protein
MKRVLLTMAALGFGVISFSSFRSAAQRTRAATAIDRQQLSVATNRLAQTQEKVSSLREVVRAKQTQLGAFPRHPDISPELLQLLRGNFSKATPAAWAELRQQLSIGWDASPDYVLVSKSVLKKLQYSRLCMVNHLTDTACNILGISPEEESAVDSVFQHGQDEWRGVGVKRTEPSGDIVAEYTAVPPDPAFVQSFSNNVASGVTEAIGPERASLLLADGWREFRNELGPAEAETMTIRRTEARGQPDLVCEMSRDGKVYGSSPVRYANYPSSWFLACFPGGWADLARVEGFELPKRYQGPTGSP